MEQQKKAVAAWPARAENKFADKIAELKGESTPEQLARRKADAEDFVRATA